MPIKIFHFIQEFMRQMYDLTSIALQALEKKCKVHQNPSLTYIKNKLLKTVTFNQFTLS